MPDRTSNRHEWFASVLTAEPGSAARNRSFIPTDNQAGAERLLDRMTDVPAFIQNGRWSMLAADALARALTATGRRRRCRRTHRRTQPRPTFLDPRAANVPGLAQAAGDTVTQLRAEIGRRPDDRDLNTLIGELTSRSPQFAALWATRNVRWHTTGTKKFVHRVAGDLELDYEAMELAADAGHVLVTFTAAPDTASAQALAFLTSWSAAPTRADRVSELPR